MPFDLHWFTGQANAPRPATPKSIDSIKRAALFGPEGYDADPGLVQAVNMALCLDMPLLLTGEPGTGKTQLAEKLAAELGVDLWRFETRSVSQAQELLYEFDHVARFHAAQLGERGEGIEALNFVDYGPLGKAVLQGLAKDEARGWFAKDTLPDWCGEAVAPRRAVVLIDEIDKAPADFPNDLLNELEKHEFRVRELGANVVLKAERTLRPIIVITSNEERALPDAFLRRCVFFHLEPMGRERLARITRARLEKAGLRLSDQRLKEALDEYERLRSDQLDLLKKPSTAEFLAFAAWLAVSDGAVKDAAPVLLKTAEDGRGVE